MKTTVIILLSILIMFSKLLSQGISYNQQFEVSTCTNFRCTYERPYVAKLQDGGFVICWQRYIEDGFGENVFCQLINADGKKRGNEFQVNTYAIGNQINPSATGLQDGGFVVCWAHWEQDVSKNNIYVQRYNSFGDKKGNECQVNVNTSNGCYSPVIISLQNGNFVVCWWGVRQYSGSYIYGQIYNLSGNKIGNEFQVNLNTHNSNDGFSMAELSNDEFVVCWNGVREGESIFFIFGQIFDSIGNKKGNEFQVNTQLNASFGKPIGIRLQDGRFVVCWSNYDQFSHSSDIFGQILDSAGAKIGNEFLVSTVTTDWNEYASVAALQNGGFFVCWQKNIGWKDYNYGIFCQLFNTVGAKRGTEFQLNPYGDSYEKRPFALGLANSGFLVCWEKARYPASIFGKYFLNEPIIHKLQAYSLIEPANDITLNTTRPAFRWQQPSVIRECYPWELTFDLYIDTNSNFTNPQIIKNIEDTTYSIDSLAAGKTYFWKVLAKNLAGDSLWSTQQDWGFYIHPSATSVEMAEQKLPAKFELYQNYPNPFNSSTKINCFISKNSFIVLKVYDFLGKEMATLVNEEKSAGYYTFEWDARDLPSGVYLCQLQMGNLQSTKKLLLLK